jgi:5-methylcytosine-specific restriction endonuclease McrA
MSAPVRLPAMPARQLAPPDNLLRMSRTARSVVRRVTGRRNRLLALALWNRDDGRCGRCGLPIDPTLHWLDPLALTIGHIEPHSLGGTYDPRNLRPEHRVCNLTAGHRDPAAVASPVRP